MIFPRGLYTRHPPINTETTCQICQCHQSSSDLWILLGCWNSFSMRDALHHLNGWKPDRGAWALLLFWFCLVSDDALTSASTLYSSQSSLDLLGLTTGEGWVCLMPAQLLPLSTGQVTVSKIWLITATHPPGRVDTGYPQAVGAAVVP